MTTEKQSEAVSPQVTEQPVQQGQPVQQVQYVMMEKSLKGVGGWLIFWMIVFSIAAISYISIFFTSMMALPLATSIVALNFSPLLAVGYISSVVMMAMQKRLAKLITWITLGVSALFTIINSIVAYLAASGASNACNPYVSSYSSCRYSYEPERSIPLLIGGILISLVVHGLIALYFILSKRVKETLVN